MKFTYKILLALFVILAITSGCQKFLDEPKPTESLAPTSIYSSVEGVQAYFSGIYRRFRGQYTATDAGGLYSMYFARTIKGNDFIQNSHYNFDYAHENREPTYRRVNFTWNFCFDIINHANSAIKGISESEKLADGEKVELTAQAKAIRAFMYFQLALEFQQAYAVDPNAPAPPLYSEPAIEAKGMSTMEAVYAQINSDLDDAIAGLTQARLGKSYINLSVAQGLKARVLMAMNKDWDEVESLANAAYGGDVTAALDPSAYTDGFDDISSSEWMWGMDQQSDQSNYYYVAPHAFTDHNADAYYGTFANQDFVAKFSATDVRNTFEHGYPVALGHFKYWITNKFVFSFEADIPIMRTAEMVLIEAEAKYHLNRPLEAHDLLFSLQKNRDVNAVKSSASGNDLLEEILLERRKELYAEIGVEWFDAKRLQRPITRTGNHRVFVNLPANSNLFYLKIPQAEIDANDNIDETVNVGR